MRNKGWSIYSYSKNHCYISEYKGMNSVMGASFTISYKDVDELIKVLQSVKSGHKEYCRKEIDRLQRQLNE